jgi:hypothetical protein
MKLIYFIFLFYRTSLNSNNRIDFIFFLNCLTFLGILDFGTYLEIQIKSKEFEKEYCACGPSPQWLLVCPSDKAQLGFWTHLAFQPVATKTGEPRSRRHRWQL